MILREKILLGLVGVAAVGAALSYAPALLSPKPIESKRVPIDFPALIAEVQMGLKEGEPTEREERVLVAANTEWVRDPLRKRPLMVEEVVEDADPNLEYVTPLPEYMGFFRIGDKLIAIIDGKDYRSGEAIEGGEFTLAEIYSDHIELLRRGAIDPVNVPLEKPSITGQPEITGEPQ